MASDEFKQEALFDSGEFKKPESQQFLFESTDELVESGYFDDAEFWKAIRGKGRTNA